MPTRIDQLVHAVHETPGYEDWRADFSPASLDSLGQWFADHVDARLRTPAEIESIRAALAFPMDIPIEELTNRTFSLAIDVGMYLTEVLLHNNPRLRLTQMLKARNNADYGQPVIVGSGPVPLNPVAIIVTLAYGLVSRNKAGSRLRQLHDVWAEKLAGAS